MKTKFMLPALLVFSFQVTYAQTLQTVTTNGNTTANEIISTGTGSRFILDGTDWRWIQWRSDVNTENAWVGYGDQGSPWFGISNNLGSVYLKTPGVFDVRSRMLVNHAPDDPSSALRVHGNIRLTNRGYSYIVNSYATMGETVSGAATIIGNNAITNKDVAEQVDFAYSTVDGSNAMVMSYYWGTMFHVKPTGTFRNAGDKWFNVGDGNNEVMRLTPAQNVLIGTTADDGVHRLQVKGNIKARKIKVTQTGWADFVFEPGYRLPSLYELEQFIRRHKHLPDIPSAKEVEENGIDLGDMNRRLLQKVEEQALYIIELNKQVADMRKQMDAIMQRLNTAVPAAPNAHQ